MFITSSDTVPITKDGIISSAEITPEMNVIWCKRRFNHGDRHSVISTVTMTVTESMLSQGREPEINLSKVEDAVLKRAIVRWDGPDCHGIAVTPEAINMLDPADALYRNVQAHAMQAWKESAGIAGDPKAPTTTSVSGAGASDSALTTRRTKSLGTKR